MTWGMVGGAAISAVGGLFGQKSAKKSQQKAEKAALEAQKQQRLWDVEDRDKARSYDLEDRTARQGLLNPYAQYFKGEKLAKPPVPMTEPTVPPPVVPPISSGGGGRNYNDRYRTQQR